MPLALGNEIVLCIVATERKGFRLTLLRAIGSTPLFYAPFLLTSVSLTGLPLARLPAQFYTSVFRAGPRNSDSLISDSLAP
jgi:hypothetical protein